MVTYPIVPQRTALVVVDMVNDFIEEGAPLETAAGRAMVPKLAELLEVCRSAGVSVVFTVQEHRPDGSDMGRMADFWGPVRKGRALREGSRGAQVFEPLRPQQGDIVVVKRRYSAFFNTDLDTILRCKGIETLIFAGVGTNACVESTVRDAFCRDYKNIFLSDGTATMDLPDRGWGPISREDAQRYALTLMSSAFAQVMSVDEVLRALAGITA